jgi:thymidylate synthase (FAD)
MKTEVLDKGYIELVDYYPRQPGPELAIANSARLSFGVTKDKLDEKDAGLINFLMRERHATPFEAPDLTFHVKAPVFVAREWQRHRMASYNELSQRYKQVPMEFYIPKLEHVRTQKGKPGSYVFEPLCATDEAEWVIEQIENVYNEAARVYEILVKGNTEGLAKELARCVLPIGIYTEFVFKTNLRSLLNFLSLRTHETAQLEIREYALAIEDMIKKVCPITMEAWDKHGRQSI